jgi:hypothetical protein
VSATGGLTTRRMGRPKSSRSSIMARACGVGISVGRAAGVRRSCRSVGLYAPVFDEEPR